MAKFECLVYCKHPMLKIDCIPCQSDQLTGTKSGFKNQRVLLVIV